MTEPKFFRIKEIQMGPNEHRYRVELQNGIKITFLNGENSKPETKIVISTSTFNVVDKKADGILDQTDTINGVAVRDYAGPINDISKKIKSEILSGIAGFWKYHHNSVRQVAVLFARKYRLDKTRKMGHEAHEIHNPLIGRGKAPKALIYTVGKGNGHKRAIDYDRGMRITTEVGSRDRNIDYLEYRNSQGTLVRISTFVIKAWESSGLSLMGADPSVEFPAIQVSEKTQHSIDLFNSTFRAMRVMLEVEPPVSISSSDLFANALELPLLKR